MSRLTAEQYLQCIRRESQRFREVLTDADPETTVPSCPEWTADDLLLHLAHVQHWWTHVLTTRPASPEGYAEPERPATHEDLIAYFDEGSGKLDKALTEADPAEAAWTWSSNPAHHNVGFILRRQAHEALIHRVDAELTVGTPTALDPALATDGVEEALDVMFGGLPPWGTWDPLPHYVRIDIADTGESVWSQLGLFSGTTPSGTEINGEDDQHVVTDPGCDPDAVVTGPAAVLDAWLWRRGDDEGIRVAGNREIYGRWRNCVNHPID